MGRFSSGKKLGSSGSYPPSGLDVTVVGYVLLDCNVFLVFAVWFIRDSHAEFSCRKKRFKIMITKTPSSGQTKELHHFRSASRDRAKINEP